MALKTLRWVFNVVLVIADQSYIELYEEANFGGKQYVLYESDDDLSGAFNDRASSFKVRNQSRISCEFLSHQLIREHAN